MSVGQNSRIVSHLPSSMIAPVGATGIENRDVSSGPKSWRRDCVGALSAAWLQSENREPSS